RNNRVPRIPHKISYGIVSAHRAWSSALTPSPSSTASSITPSMSDTSTTVKFIDTLPTTAARFPATITQPSPSPDDASRRNPSAYPALSSATRISRFATNVAPYPTAVPASTVRTPSTQAFHVSTGLTFGCNRASTPPPFSMGRQYPYSESPARTIARAPAAFACCRTHCMVLPSSTAEVLPICTKSGFSPAAANCANASENSFCASAVVFAPATSEQQRCVIAPSHDTHRDSASLSSTLRKPTPTAAPCRVIPVSTSTCTLTRCPAARAAFSIADTCSAVHTTGVRPCEISAGASLSSTPLITMMRVPPSPSAARTFAPSSTSVTP